MLLVHTQEVSVDFTGFKLDVTSPPDCSCSDYENAACSECGVKTIAIDATEAQSGAVDQRVTLRARRDALARVLREALAMVESE